jgi:hypothetical protein
MKKSHFSSKKEKFLFDLAMQDVVELELTG